MLTTAGKDMIASSVGDGTGSRVASIGWMAITANATAPSAGDTTLTAEIATAGGGLIRKASTYAHTGGASTFTESATFTVNGSDTGLPVTVAKMGLFNASSAGSMVFETLLSTTATVSAVGDSLTITDTVTLS